ncbi:hypothetical protein [Chryseobacterium herbae]|uniref:Uncharacterized protein n=1 Tax=Chryseobacterium herbae TaxID=2976476 RepID=A0ABT2INK6_9FLAO|nr:hypothetical protein [Chryseobacterium sp. pc1-10]MCT2560407.1 hypothetical protein [Chryseobacterium sp. pc1-10]
MKKNSLPIGIAALVAVSYRIAQVGINTPGSGSALNVSAKKQQSGSTVPMNRADHSSHYSQPDS